MMIMFRTVILKLISVTLLLYEIILKRIKLEREEKVRSRAEIMEHYSLIIEI